MKTKLAFALICVLSTPAFAAPVRLHIPGMNKILPRAAEYECWPEYDPDEGEWVEYCGWCEWLSDNVQQCRGRNRQ